MMCVHAWKKGTGAHRPSSHARSEQFVNVQPAQEQCGFKEPTINNKRDSKKGKLTFLARSPLILKIRTSKTKTKLKWERTMVISTACIHYDPKYYFPIPKLSFTWKYATPFVGGITLQFLTWWPVVEKDLQMLMNFWKVPELLPFLQGRIWL